MTIRLQPSAARLFGLCLLAATFGLPAEAASPRTTLQRDRATCARLAGDAHQNCLSEARTTFAATQPSAAGEDAASLARNTLQRCERLPDPDKKDCVARMQGLGTTSGSVAGGGIYRELVTTETQPPATSADAR